MKISLLFVFILLVPIGCATTMPDRITRLAPIEVSQKIILIQPFEFDPNIATNVDASFVKDFGGELIDLKNSNTLMRFYITKKSNWTYSNSEAAVRENINEIAQEIVNSIFQK